MAINNTAKEERTFTLSQIGSSPEVLIAALTALKEEQDKNKALQMSAYRAAHPNAMPTAPPVVPVPPVLVSTTSIAKELNVPVMAIYQKLSYHRIIRRVGENWAFCGGDYGELVEYRTDKNKPRYYPKWNPSGKALILRLMALPETPQK